MSDFSVLLAASALALSAATALLLLALARQVGLVLVRLGPDVPMVNHEGIDLDTIIPPLSYEIETGGRVTVAAGKKKTMMVFLSGSCVACQQLVEVLPTFSRMYEREVVTIAFVRQSERQAEMIGKLLSNGVLVSRDEESFDRFGVLGTPFATLLGRGNLVESRGTPNNLGQLESLLQVQRLHDVRAHSRKSAAAGQEDRHVEVG